MLITCVALNFLYMHIICLWVLYVCVGFHIAILLSAGYAMANQYMEVTSVAAIGPYVGASVGDVLLMCIVARSYQQYGPYSVWMHLVPVSIILLCAITGMQIVGRHMGDRFEKGKNSKAP